ncbi:C-type lectin domain family 17, member A-like [Chanodichthys erythropterus]|uniref:C-type lectin domain family 17, member A-like n=1 Tax=Chanodichthys erythropterus TaxID=933992 RepID=UPI00351F63CD
MSDGIYEDVIRTESEGMNTDRMEMIVEIYESAECVRDHDFRTETNTHQPLQRTGSVCVKIRSSRAAAVCLVLLCVLLLTAVIVLCVTFTLESRQLISKNENLTNERDQLKLEKNDLQMSLGKLALVVCLLQTCKLLRVKKGQQQTGTAGSCSPVAACSADGWIYFQSSLYFISTEKKNWAESRRYCTERGADLIIINNREEHGFASNSSDGFWIGLTDSDVEGRWKWVDGTNMTSGIWESGQPNCYSGNEDCVFTYPTGWHDNPCNDAFRWICEKNIFK